MLSADQVKEIILESLGALNEEKKPDELIRVAHDTVLLGRGSMLDSLDFILLVTNVEERLHAAAGRDIEVVAPFESFEEQNPFRSVTTLSEHIASNLLVT